MICLLDFLEIKAVWLWNKHFYVESNMYLQFGVSFPRKILQLDALEMDIALNLLSLFLLGMPSASRNNRGTNKKRGLFFLHNEKSRSLDSCWLWCNVQRCQGWYLILYPFSWNIMASSAWGSYPQCRKGERGKSETAFTGTRNFCWFFFLGGRGRIIDFLLMFGKLGRISILAERQAGRLLCFLASVA